MGAPREGGSVGGRQERRRIPRLDHSVHQGARRGDRRQRRGLGSHADAGRGVNLPVHTLLITALGINILDNQDLEALAETAAKLKRWEFMITINPMPITGGTGSPMNTIATFLGSGALTVSLRSPRDPAWRSDRWNAGPARCLHLLRHSQRRAANGNSSQHCSRVRRT